MRMKFLTSCVNKVIDERSYPRDLADTGYLEKCEFKLTPLAHGEINL